MGNCLSDKVVAQNEQENRQEEMEGAEKIGSSGRMSQGVEPKLRSQDNIKKRVHFKLEEETIRQKVVVQFENPDENKADSEPERSETGSEMEEVRSRLKNGEGERGEEVVRVRVVVTKKELQTILNGGYSNVEELIAGFKSRGRRVSELRSSQTGSINGSWRPDLENIAEERC